MKRLYPSHRLLLMLAVFLSSAATGVTQSQQFVYNWRPPSETDKNVYFKWHGQLKRIGPDGQVAIYRGGGRWPPVNDEMKQVVLGDKKFWAFADRLYLQATNLSETRKASTYCRLNGIYYQIHVDGRVSAWREPQGRWEAIETSALRMVMGRQQYWLFAGRRYENRSQRILVPEAVPRWSVDVAPPLWLFNGAKPSAAGHGNVPLGTSTNAHRSGSQSQQVRSD